MPVLSRYQGVLLLRVLMRCWSCSYDINVTPDKRTTFLHHEDELLSALQEVLFGGIFGTAAARCPGRLHDAHRQQGSLQALQELWEPSRSTFAISNVVRSSQQQLITHTMRPTQTQVHVTWRREPGDSACLTVPSAWADTIGMQDAMDSAGTAGEGGYGPPPLSVPGVPTSAVPEASAVGRCAGRQHALLQPHLVSCCASPGKTTVGAGTLMKRLGPKAMRPGILKMQVRLMQALLSLRDLVACGAGEADACGQAQRQWRKACHRHMTGRAPLHSR